MPIRLGGMISGLDTDAIVKELMSAQSLKKTNIENKKTKLDWKKEKWEELNTKIYSLYTEKLTGLKLQGGYLTKKVASSDESRVKATATSASNGSYSIEVKSLASAQYVTGADISSKNLSKSSLLKDAGMSLGQTITISTMQEPASASQSTGTTESTSGTEGTAGTENTGATETVTAQKVMTPFTFEVKEDSTIADLLGKMNEAGLNASFDNNTGRFYISAKQTGEDGKFTISSTDTGATGLAALGLEEITEQLATSGRIADDSSQVAVVAASDANVILNGARISSATNIVDVNGLTLELIGTTNEGSPISLTVGNDIDAVYDKVKDFVKSYNELLTSMYEQYTAKSAKDYHMLSDEEKEAMSDEEVKLWEDKIKSALLRNDTTLNSLMGVFRNSMQGTAEVDGKSYALSNFGIGTGTYTEHGLLHIDGDKDDGTYAEKTDKLRKALEDDPEGTSKALSQIMSKFYNTLTEKMSVSSISSALTFYNDKQIKSQTDDYDKQIKNWENKLKDMEDRYYKQFSTMESSMAKLQSQQQQMANMMGF
ncbi:MAG: flagellar filament capping protein FliD [Lachnospiraceae bacterium]|nr:flagellar filament capping protein FliD [Lachnospiraceae bacterium]